MDYTEQDLKFLKALKDKGVSAEEAFARLSKVKKSAKPVDQPSFFQKVKNYGSSIVEGLKEGEQEGEQAQKIREQRAEKGEVSKTRGIVPAFSQEVAKPLLGAAEAAIRPVADFVSEIPLPYITEKGEERERKGFFATTNLKEALSPESAPKLQKLITDLQDFKGSLPSYLQQQIEDFGPIVEVFGLAEGGKLVKDIAKQGAKQGINVAKQTIEKAPSIPDLNTVGKAIKDLPLKIFNLDENYKELATKDLGNYLNSKKSLQSEINFLKKERNVDVVDYLSRPKIYKGIKSVDGAVDPTEAISELKTNIQALLEAKRDFLPEADKYAPKISREEVRERALKDIKGQFTRGIENDLAKAINKEIDLLPDSISLEELDDFRRKARKSSRDAKGRLKSTSEYAALENAARNAVFDATDKLPFDTNGQFAALNNQIKDYIEVEKFLDKKLRGQKVKGGRLNKYAAKAVGAIAGSSGGALGALAGSELGGLISDLIVNNQLGSSIKMRLVRQLTDDVDVIDQVEQLLQTVRDYKPLELPAPSTEFRSVINSSEPINLPATTQSGIDAREQARRSAGTITTNRQANDVDFKKPEQAQATKELQPLYNEARKYKSAEEFVDKANSINPSENGVFQDYTPELRNKIPLGDNIQTLDKSVGGKPDDVITIYRGTSYGKINSGDFVTTNKQLAKDYSGTGNIQELKVRKGDVIDSVDESGGEEYLYRPNADKQPRYSKSQLTNIWNEANQK